MIQYTWTSKAIKCGWNTLEYNGIKWTQGCVQACTFVHCTSINHRHKAEAATDASRHKTRQQSHSQLGQMSLAGNLAWGSRCSSHMASKHCLRHKYAASTVNMTQCCWCRARLALVSLPSNSVRRLSSLRAMGRKPAWRCLLLAFLYSHTARYTFTSQ